MFDFIRFYLELDYDIIIMTRHVIPGHNKTQVRLSFLIIKWWCVGNHGAGVGDRMDGLVTMFEEKRIDSMG